MATESRRITVHKILLWTVLKLRSEHVPGRMTDKEKDVWRYLDDEVQAEMETSEFTYGEALNELAAHYEARKAAALPVYLTPERVEEFKRIYGLVDRDFIKEVLGEQELVPKEKQIQIKHS